MADTLKDVAEIVCAYLHARGFDGLYEVGGDCACDIDDLFPCQVEGVERCRPGYRAPCDCGDHDWHIQAEPVRGYSKRKE